MQNARVAIALVGVLSLVTAVSAAEDKPQLEPGARVRVESATAEERFVGRLLALDDKSLNLQVEDEEEPRLLPREDITALAVSRGRRSRGWGALIGAGAGVALGLALSLDEWRNADDYPGSMEFAVRAVLTVPIGAAIGLAIPPGERWEDVPLDNVRVSVRSVPGRGAGVFVTIGF